MLILVFWDEVSTIVDGYQTVTANPKRNSMLLGSMNKDFKCEEKRKLIL